MSAAEGLSIQAVSVRFGGHMALREVDVDAALGQVTGLIGPNGAGKTTLFNVVTGLITPTHGHVTLAGRSLDGMSPNRRAHLGLARTFQRLELFTSLTVRDNVRAAMVISRGGRAARVAGREVDAVLERVGIAHLGDREVSEVPTGMARRVELARCLVTRPRVLLLDEPASGQDEHETAAFAELLTSLAADGMGVLLVEHDISLVMAACTYLYVLDFGHVIAHGTPEDIRRNPTVIAAYLGTEHPS